MCQWAGVPGGPATTSRRAGSRRLLPEDADWPFSSRLSSVPRTEPCGYRRITAALWRRGVVVDRDTVRSIMREQGLVAAQPRRKVRTTVPAADLGSRPDLVKRDFTASQPG